MKRILVTATGGAVAATILQMIKDVSVVDFEIIATDMHIDTSFLETVSHFEYLPSAGSDDYTTKLLNCISKYEPDYILPLTEEECLQVSRLAEEDLLPCKYLGMSSDTISLIMDKVECMKKLAVSNVLLPQFREISSFDCLEQSMRELGFPDKKIVFKPKSGRGSRGFRVVDENIEKVVAFEQKGAQTYVTLDMLKYSFEDEPERIKEYFVMEFLTGKLGGCDMVAFDGEALAAFPAFPKDGLWGAYTHVDLKIDPELKKYCTNCAHVLGMHGLCNVEAGYDGRGNVKLIEVNSRTSATAHQNSLVGPNNMDLFMRAQLGKKEYFEQTKEATYRLLLEMYRT